MAKKTFTATTSIMTNMVLVCLGLVLVAMMAFMTMRLRSSPDDASPQARERTSIEHARRVVAECAGAASVARRALADRRVTMAEMGRIDAQVEKARIRDADACPVKPKHMDRAGAIEIPDM
jgi:hypothetical protein